MDIIGRNSNEAERVGRIKTAARSLAKNLAYLFCLMSPIAVIGAVWFDITPVVALRTVYGGIPLLAAFIMAERVMMDIGRDAGKRDDELLAVREAYHTLREIVIRQGTAGLGDYLSQEIADELEITRRTACRKLGLNYHTYLENYAGKSRSELKSAFKSDTNATLKERVDNRVRVAKILAVNRISPIELSEDMLLCDTLTPSGRGGIGQTAEEYCQKRRGIKGTLWSILSVILFTGIAIGQVRTFTPAIVLYTLWALMLLLYRMARGYKDGVIAEAEVQVRNYRDRMRYLEGFIEWKSPDIHTSEPAPIVPEPPPVDYNLTT